MEQEIIGEKKFAELARAEFLDFFAERGISKDKLPEEYQRRVLDELADGVVKYAALRTFIEFSPKFVELDRAEALRLRRQLAVLELYNGVLEERVFGFAEKAGLPINHLDD